MKVTAASLAATATAVAFATSAAVGSPEPPPKLSGEKLAELMQLSLSEIKDRMETIFSFIDTNGDGVITTEEAQQWSTRLKDAMHKHQVRQEFISIDKDGDGKITLEELEVTYTDGADAANQEAHKVLNAFILGAWGLGLRLRIRTHGENSQAQGGQASLCCAAGGGSEEICSR